MFDPNDGTVVALHFGGVYLKTNYGVPAFQLGRDSRLVDTGLNFAGPTSQASGPWDAFWLRTEAAGQESASAPAPPPVAPARVARPAPPPRLHQASFTIPLTVTVSLGEPGPQSVTVGGQTVSWGPATGDDDAVAEVESAVEDYADRRGYDPDFLGQPVPLPLATRNAADILDISTASGTREEILRYEHFSVQMSRSRRMCLWSAVNIDGGQSRKAKRVGWRRDPRIAAEAQIIAECYGIRRSSAAAT